MVRKCSKDHNDCNPYYTFLPHSRRGIKETLKYGGCMDIQIEGVRMSQYNLGVRVNFYTCSIDSPIILHQHV